MELSRTEVIQLMERALKEAERTYNQVGEGDITFSEAGDRFHSYLGDDILTALSKGLIELKEDHE